MRRFKQARVTPPSGFVYLVPETNVEIRAGDFDNLVDRVRKHLAVNKRALPDGLASTIEHYICLINPASFCIGESEDGDRQSVVTSAQKIKDATNMASTRLKWGADRFLTSQDEAERRAEICMNCRENFRGVCTTCNGLKDYVVKAIGDRVTRRDAQLGVCTFCSCLIKAKVHISAEALKVVTPPGERDRYPDHCWMRSI